MRLLLDSHILLAMVAEQTGDLPPRMRDALRDTGSDMFASVASLWEIAIKWRLGKLKLNTTPDRLPRLFEELKLDVLVVNAHHAVADLESEPDTRDPFDRLLLAQCQVEGLRLVTLDRALAAHPLTWRSA